MNEREQLHLNKKKEARGIWKRFGSFFFFLLLIGGGLWLTEKKSVPNHVKPFSWREEGGELIIAGLEPKDIQEIDWQQGVQWIPFGDKVRQWLLPSKKLSFWQKLIKKPASYSTWSDLEEEKIRNKKIKFEGNLMTDFTTQIVKITPATDKAKNFFAEKSNSNINRIFNTLTNLAIITLILWFLLYFFFNYNLFSAFITKRSGSRTIIPHFSFREVGGLQEAKEELGEIVAYFRDPYSFQRYGAKVPKGILLVGPPGNGKTLLAKALAGECKRPFLFRSGSEFEEGLVGLGARRMRELFHRARQYPQGCIIFIDEIDAIGRKRYSTNSGHAEQTLNQLLNELDGFQPRDNIIILAATNALNVLDSALLRPGRFDRHIYIPLPNLKARREIISLQLNSLQLKNHLDLEEVAVMTKGLSGAQIANIFNEAAILSLRNNKKVIDQTTIFEAHDRVLMGPSLISQTLTPFKRKIVAYHEAGHAIIGLSLPETIVKKITIIPRWAAGGYTWIELWKEQNDDYLINKSQMLAQVMTSLGGRASEELVFGTEYITVGAYDDFKKASELIRALILRYGMSELGIIPTQENFFHSEEVPSELPEIAKREIEKVRKKILDQCWKKVKIILQHKRRVLDLLAQALLQKNSLHKGDINYIYITHLPSNLHFLNSNSHEK